MTFAHSNVSKRIVHTTAEVFAHTRYYLHIDFDKTLIALNAEKCPSSHPGLKKYMHTFRPILVKSSNRPSMFLPIF